MTYDFAMLSPPEFENLARDLIGREFGVRFEGFTEGADDGMDGRHAAAGDHIILQAKHYLRSGMTKLKATMKKERATIDALETKRYILVTSAPLSPAGKSAIATIIGPSLQNISDIFGPEDLNGLLRKFPAVETAHPKLWSTSAAVLQKVVTTAVTDAFSNRRPIPPVLAQLLPRTAADTYANPTEPPTHDTLFLIKSSPHDDEFALWLAPKLEAEGYRIFADILTLQPGDHWRREINRALEHRAAKVLLVSRTATLDDPAVEDDIDIAIDIASKRGDPRFIIPLRLGMSRKVKGIGDTLAVDFMRGWGEGLTRLLDTLKRQKVPRKASPGQIDPNWELFRRRGAVPLIPQPERLTSNWLRIVEAPDAIHHYTASGACDPDRLKRAVAAYPFPAVIHGRGFLAFAGQAEVDEAFEATGRFHLERSIPTVEFLERGVPALGIERQTASNWLIAMMREAWTLYCQDRGLLEYRYAKSIGFHASPALAAIGQKIPWGRQGDRRSSMLRNIAKGHVWQFGVTALPATWPFWHFKLKSRVLFATDNGTASGGTIDDPKKMHKLRRSICKGWRNKQWHGRMLAYLELLSGDRAYVRLRLAADAQIVVDAAPVLFSSPVSTMLPDVAGSDDEETDTSTLGRPEHDEPEMDEKVPE